MRRRQRQHGFALLSMFFLLTFFVVIALLAAQTTRLSMRMVREARDVQESTTAFDEAVRRLRDDVRRADTIAVEPQQISLDGVTWAIEDDALVRGEQQYATRLTSLRFEPGPAGARLMVGDDDAVMLPNAAALRGAP